MIRTTRKLLPLLLLLFCWISTASDTSFGSLKAAYKSHFRGTINYSEGQYQQAVRNFQRAYDIVPTNYNFALSLALGLSRVGRAKEGLKILKRGAYKLKDTDPDYDQKNAFRYFFEGMIHCYNKDFGRAISPLKKGVKLQEPLDQPDILSIFQSSLGFAMLMDQGKGSDAGADLPPHYHVHKRDMVKARELFEQALDNDASNPSANTNYKMISDSLGLTVRDTFLDRAGNKNKVDRIPYGNVPTNVFKLMEFGEYEEVLFLLDISGSMVMEKVICLGTTRFQVMKETALFMLDAMAPETKIGIGTIGGDCGTDPRLWLYTGKLERKDLRRELEFLAPDGTTPLLTILQASTQLFSDSLSGKRSIFLISDGANICNAGGIDICDWSQRLASERITINTLTFLNADLSQTDAFAEYSCLTQNTGGRIEYMDIYNCKVEPYTFNMVQTCQFYIPELRKVECWGPSVKNLWAIFEE